MRGQFVLGNDEKKSWFNIEVSIGRNNQLINEDIKKLHAFLKTFSEPEILLLENYTKSSLDITVFPSITSKRDLRFLLIKKFIDNNKLSIIADYIGSSLTGNPLEKQIFLRITEDLFIKGKFPREIYSYCAYRVRGSPTTWLKINNNRSTDEIINMVDQKIKSLCNRLTRRLRIRFKIRSIQKTDKNAIYILTKPRGAVVIKTEGLNTEAQKVSFSLLIVDIKDKKIGFVSSSKKEVMEVQKYIKEIIFPDQVYLPRQEIEYDAKELFRKMLLVDNSGTPLEIVGIKLKGSKLPNSPSIELESNDNRSIDQAIVSINPIMEDLDISFLKEVKYQLEEQRVIVYAYGDVWKRRFLNVKSLGKSSIFEGQILDELKRLIGAEVKETKFIVEKLSVEEIVQKLLSIKRINIDQPLPESVEKVVVDLVKYKLLKQPKKISKRRCTSCWTASWTEWVCPNCRREMYIAGEAVTIEVFKPRMFNQLKSFLEENLIDYDVVKVLTQRRKYKKHVLRIVNKKNNVATYLVTVFNKKDLHYCEALAKEGYGLITVFDPSLSIHNTEIENLGGYPIDLYKVITELKLLNETQPSLLLPLFKEAIGIEENKLLGRIYDNLNKSVALLAHKTSDYTEDLFEIDIKNIFQAIVPNVVRLGTKFKGKKVPDGYCSFKSMSKFNRLFGWDAKYSLSSGYKLYSRDFKKQQGYIKWLCINEEPKIIGKLRIYAIISNFDKDTGFRKVLFALRKSSSKPRLCRVILIEDRLLAELGNWILKNAERVIKSGPLIGEIFFKLILSARNYRWKFSVGYDWLALKSNLDNI